MCLIDTADEGLDPINGLAIDVSENTLFWSHQNIVYTKSPPDATGSPQEIDPGDSIPFGLAASNRKLYWTQVGNSSANIPGAIYSYDITSGERAILYSNSTIEPLDISSSLFGEGEGGREGRGGEGRGGGKGGGEGRGGEGGGEGGEGGEREEGRGGGEVKEREEGGR